MPGVGKKRTQEGDKDVKVLGSVGDKTELDGTKWNKLTIVAVGNRLIHMVNDVVTVDVTGKSSRCDHQRAPWTSTASRCPHES